MTQARPAHGLGSDSVRDAATGPLADKAFVIDQPVGRGRLIASRKTTFRAYPEASELLFVNAVRPGPVP